MTVRKDVVLGVVRGVIEFAVLWLLPSLTIGLVGVPYELPALTLPLALASASLGGFAYMSRGRPASYAAYSARNLVLILYLYTLLHGGVIVPARDALNAVVDFRPLLLILVLPEAAECLVNLAKLVKSRGQA